MAYKISDECISIGKGVKTVRNDALAFASTSDAELNNCNRKVCKQNNP